MRFSATGMVLALTCSVGAGVIVPKSVHAAAPYCPNAAHARPQQVPAELMAAVAKTFQIDAATVKNAAFVRCVGSTLMGCYVGANLDCDKADTHRALPGATAWCRDNPGSQSIPMAATGHATIYAWSCNGKRAVAGKALMAVDRQGYIAANWKEIQ
jgi:hypothetical protein